MTENTVYQAPKKRLEDQQNDTIRFFALYQRIGRLRYFSFCLSSITLCVFTGVFFSVLLSLAGGLNQHGFPNTGPYTLITGMVICTVPIASISALTILSVRRLHDLNRSGWWALLLLVPLLNLLFWLLIQFAPGTKAANSYGRQPQHNTTATWLIAIFGAGLGLLLTLAIIVALVLPMYSDYVPKKTISMNPKYQTFTGILFADQAALITI